MKKNKFERRDDIPAKMLKCMMKKATAELVNTCQRIHTTGEWPKDFNIQ